MGKLMSKILNKYSIFIIRIVLVLTLTMIGLNVSVAFYSTLTGDVFTAILSIVITMLLIKVNKEVQ